MTPKVYLETSVLSYLAAKPSNDVIASGRQVITHRWWETERKQYRLVVSEAVVVESERGDPQMVERRRKLLQQVSLFPINETILEIAKLLVIPGVIPEKAGRTRYILQRQRSSGAIFCSPGIFGTSPMFVSAAK